MISRTSIPIRITHSVCSVIHAFVCLAQNKFSASASSSLPPLLLCDCDEDETDDRLFKPPVEVDDTEFDE